MAMEGVGTTIDRGGAVGEVVSISLPDDVNKEFECTSLDDTREQFLPSAMKEAQEALNTAISQLNTAAKKYDEAGKKKKAISGEKREEVMQNIEEKRQEVEQRLERLRDEGISIPTIPTREEIEERIPAQPETTGKSEVPGRPQTQE